MTERKLGVNLNSSLPEEYTFTDIFDLKEMQHLQDLFSDVHGVSSIISDPEGIPYTKPSNFSKLCGLIQQTEKGFQNCIKSDAAIGKQKLNGATVQPCLSCGLWDAGVSINVGDKHIGNWLIGQIRNEDTDENKILNYANELGISKKEFMKAYYEIPEMSLEKFNKVAEILYVFVNQLAQKTYSSIQLEKQIKEKEIVNRLKEVSEFKYQSMYKNALVALFRTELSSGRIIEANNVSAEIFGYKSRKEFLNEFVSVNHYYNPDDREMVLAELKAKGKIDKLLMHAKKKDGSEVWHEAYFKVNKKENYIDCVAINVTDKINAQQQLHKSEAKFTNAFYKHQTPMILVNVKTGKLIDKNRGFLQLFEFQKDEAKTGVLFIDLPWTESFNKKEVIEKFLTENVLNDYSIVYKTKGGKVKNLRIFASMIENNEDNLAIISIFDDTLNSKNAKELELNNLRLETVLTILQSNNRNIKELLDFTLEKALVLTESKIGFIYFYNEKTKQFKLSSWSVSAMKECDVVNAETANDLDDAGCWGEAVRQRSPFVLNNYNTDNKYKKGTPKGHVHLDKFLSVPVFARNKIRAVIGVANKNGDYNERDIKQIQLLMDAVWKEIENQNFQNKLVAAKVKAEESDRLKSAFLSNMSHEIRTPMNGILGFIDLLENPDISEVEQKHFFGIVRKSSNRLLNTINDIIEISKIEAGQATIFNSLEDINEILTYHLNFFAPEAQSRGLSIKLENKLGEINIETDRLKLDSILTNLIKNALKFTNKGEIVFGCSQEGEKIKFFVKDTGIGISADRVLAVFNRFEQADLGINRGYEGSGLGLSISKAYSEMLGGKIWVESDKGKGSTFYFTTDFKPLEKVEDLDYEENEIDGNSNEKINILVAEDDKTSFSLLLAILKNTSYHLIYAKDGLEAIQKFKENNDLHLILMDIKMPKMDGIEATKNIRLYDADIPIIAQTAYALAGDKEKILEAGFDDYLTKPLQKRILIQKIRKNIKRKKMDLEIRSS